MAIAFSAIGCGAFAAWGQAVGQRVVEAAEAQVPPGGESYCKLALGMMTNRNVEVNVFGGNILRLFVFASLRSHLRASVYTHTYGNVDELYRSIIVIQKLDVEINTIVSLPCET